MYHMYRTTIVLINDTVLCDLSFTTTYKTNLAMIWGEHKMYETGEKSDNPKLLFKLKSIQIKATNNNNVFKSLLYFLFIS